MGPLEAQQILNSSSITPVKQRSGKTSKKRLIQEITDGSEVEDQTIKTKKRLKVSKDEIDEDDLRVPLTEEAPQKMAKRQRTEKNKPIKEAVDEMNALVKDFVKNLDVNDGSKNYLLGKLAQAD